ncbi:uncharacterized protein L969DRAFT_93162 [Mixia osmundae IAM 14324]|uniref:PUA domain-containing protein n=1 Tax=Mixia osmundae (strain CBS 9802 / IAM 14324 / JCM 22182 / KY 12970) TaxID=764103 RepID=G7E5X0_MIXOS|nr:uncharacterized protein L969DRAFT_93162 [Mixia osmundae IAM 14324]KEI40618.1 hypothetical protein L969DRAFT_93162 [Mixia osmundae IAM 14324]GAA98230.1 hypothetical protein E5Q_04913 [Mixia osmundae IAM 14324]
MRNPRHQGSEGLTIVIKLGTSSIINESTWLPQLAVLSSLAETVCGLRKAGHRVVIVSSGAIAVGMRRMSVYKRPKILAEKQALAAIGQGRLIALWDSLFTHLDQPIAQVLITRSDISDRPRYLNATRTLTALLASGVVPIVNENDTLSVSEIKFGDNDTLSAITAGMVAADYLFLLTDVDCLYTENPRKNPRAKAVTVVRDIEAVRQIVSTATLGSSLGTGGMETKLIAAELAMAAGVATVITHGTKPGNIVQIVSAARDPAREGPDTEADIDLASSVELPPRASLDEVALPLHTIFMPRATPLPDRRWWVLHGLAPRGRVIIDAGAYKAVLLRSRYDQSEEDKHVSEAGNGGRLLPAGIVGVEGVFAAGQAVRLAVRTQGVDTEIARGLANYNSQEIDRIKGMKSSEIEATLGYVESEHVIEAITATSVPAAQ